MCDGRYLRPFDSVGRDQPAFLEQLLSTVADSPTTSMNASLGLQSTGVLWSNWPARGKMINDGQAKR